MPSMKLEDPYALLEGARRFHLALKRLPVLGLGILLLERGILRLLEEVRGLRSSPWDHPLARLILLLDLHERKTIAYLEGRLRPGMRVVDIGAHVGYHTKRFARLVGERGIVLAFEPDPGTFRLLQANLHKQRNVYLFNVAVTDKPGLYRLVAPASFSAAQRLVFSGGGSFSRAEGEGGGKMREEYVLGMPLGEFLDAFMGDGRIDLLKIDAEGSEVRILQTLNSWANRIEEVLCEVNPSVLASQGETPERLLDALEDLGFSRFTLVDGVPQKGGHLELPQGWIGREEVQAYLRSFRPNAEGFVNLAARR